MSNTREGSRKAQRIVEVDNGAGVASKKFALELTRGDGNCAFNAFVSGFVADLDGIEKRYREVGTTFEDQHGERCDNLIQKLAVALGMPPATPWDAVKTQIIEVAAQNPFDLQTKLAPTMREIAIVEMSKDSEVDAGWLAALKSAYDRSKKTEEGKQTDKALLAEIAQQVDQNNEKLEQTEQETLERALKNSVGSARVEAERRAGPADDIFIMHRFAMDEFKRLRALEEKGDVTDVNESLENWWNGTGREQFYIAMSQDASWAGDVELVALARYFDMKLIMVKLNSQQKPFAIDADDQQPKDRPSDITLYHSSGHWSYLKPLTAQSELCVAQQVASTVPDAGLFGRAEKLLGSNQVAEKMHHNVVLTLDSLIQALQEENKENGQKAFTERLTSDLNTVEEAQTVFENVSQKIKEENEKTPVSQGVTYTLVEDTDEKTEVTVDQQIILDGILARKLMLEEEKNAGSENKPKR
ncbi:MAG TPA: hypothetical protein VNC84_06025 [Gammaproteobacteria bacterium]|jgi:hypothetical protein|nr:hypothetical protein [Gammaproteobacteria bacterium]